MFVNYSWKAQGNWDLIFGNDPICVANEILHHQDQVGNVGI